MRLERGSKHSLLHYTGRTLKPGHHPPPPSPSLSSANSGWWEGWPLTPSMPHAFETGYEGTEQVLKEMSPGWGRLHEERSCPKDFSSCSELKGKCGSNQEGQMVVA